jgi:multicomponent Na+:H+ antiporter subunit B
LGVFLYAVTGVISLIFNDNYLNYNSISSNDITGQHIGIFSIELGVGLTVSSIMCLIYLLLREE